MRSIKVDLLAETIHRVIFIPDYITPTSTTVCHYRLRVTHDRNIMMEAKHILEKVKIDRWITNYISPIGDAALQIKGHGMINEGKLTFETKFLWLLK